MSKTSAKNSEQRYTYNQLVSQAKGFEKTILQRMLSPVREYTLAEAGAAIKEFLESEVK